MEGLENRDLAPEGLEEVMAHIEARYRENLTNPGLAALCGISVRHLERRFRRLFRVSPREFIIRRRIRAACELLRKGAPVADVAGDLGYFDQSHFTHQFKRHIGVTPAEFRRVHGACISVSTTRR